MPVRRLLLQAFGYTQEDVPHPAADAQDGGAGLQHGHRHPAAVLSDRSQLLFNYQTTFAQVTNPPIDSIRERPVMSLFSTLGEERNLLEETPEHARCCD
jgi:glutamate synthase (NADPH/NADH) large chain